MAHHVRLVLLRLIGEPATLASRLRRIHGDIRAPHDFLRLQPSFPACHADGDADIDAVAADVERRLERGKDPVGRALRLVRRAARQQHGEFVAAGARHRRAGGRGPLDAAARLDEQVVAGGMAVDVVGFLEAVEVHVEEVLVGAAVAVAKLGQKAAAIGKARQGIVIGQKADIGPAGMQRLVRQARAVQDHAGGEERDQRYQHQPRQYLVHESGARAVRCPDHSCDRIARHASQDDRFLARHRPAVGQQAQRTGAVSAGQAIQKRLIDGTSDHDRASQIVWPGDARCQRRKVGGRIDEQVPVLHRKGTGGRLAGIFRRTRGGDAGVQRLAHRGEGVHGRHHRAAVIVGVDRRGPVLDNEQMRVALPLAEVHADIVIRPARVERQDQDTERVVPDGIVLQVVHGEFDEALHGAGDGLPVALRIQPVLHARQVIKQREQRSKRRDDQQGRRHQVLARKEAANGLHALSLTW